MDNEQRRLTNICISKMRMTWNDLSCATSACAMNGHARRTYRRTKPEHTDVQNASNERTDVQNMHNEHTDVQNTCDERTDIHVENSNTRLLLISCSQGILSSSSFSCYLLLRLLDYMYLSQLMRTFTNYLKCIVFSSWPSFF